MGVVVDCRELGVSAGIVNGILSNYTNIIADIRKTTNSDDGKTSMHHFQGHHKTHIPIFTPHVFLSYKTFVSRARHKPATISFTQHATTPYLHATRYLIHANDIFQSRYTQSHASPRCQKINDNKPLKRKKHPSQGRSYPNIKNHSPKVFSIKTHHSKNKIISNKNISHRKVTPNLFSTSLATRFCTRLI